MEIEETTDADVGVADDADTGDGESSHEDSGGNREAAKYRRRLRETEAERDGLRVRLVSVQTSEVERVAGQYLAMPADLFDIANISMDELIDAETGRVDAERVADACAALLESRPGLKRFVKKGAPGGGAASFDGGVRGQSARAGVSFADLLKNRK